MRLIEGPVGRLDWTFPDIAANLALEEALLREVDEGRLGPLIRFWEHTEYAVVLGASGRIKDEVHIDACRADRVPIARRSSGGGTVVLGPGALNLAIVLPMAASPLLATVTGTQHAVLEACAAPLRVFAPKLEVVGSGDLALEGRKAAGSAQRRLRSAILVHVTILYDFELDRISRYLAVPVRQPVYRAGRPHSEFVTNLQASRKRLREALESAWIPTGQPGPNLVTVPYERVAELVRGQFGDPGWVERF